MDPQPIVFVVDDDVAVRDAIRKLITSVGLRVETFGSAGEFFSNRRPDVPACLVLDVSNRWEQQCPREPIQRLSQSRRQLSHFCRHGLALLCL
jgi:FixJ family two-component response regulator